MDAFRQLDRLADHLADRAGPTERWTLSLAAERSDFVRFTKGRVRQAGEVAQAHVTLRWIDGARHAAVRLSLSGDLDVDRGRLDEALSTLRPTVAALPDDPFLDLPSTSRDTRDVRHGRLPDGETVVADVVDAAAGLDLVGVYVGGPVWRALRTSWGQANDHLVDTWLLDASCVLDADRAVSWRLAGDAWSRRRVVDQLDHVRAILPALGRPAHRLAPSTVRAWLAPEALEEVFSLLSWDAFGGHAQATGTSPLRRLVAGEVAWSERMHLAENLRDGAAPRFGDTGHVRPDVVPLVVGGRHAGALVSPRTAREHGLTSTGAGADEQPEALDLAGGDLPEAEALQRLGTGVAVSNLWYTNHADRNQARVTGMTRFATFWCEGGERVAPLAPMRFDDSLHDLFGDRLVDLSTERTLLPSTSTYGGRSLASMRLPGALVSGLRFTL